MNQNNYVTVHQSSFMKQLQFVGLYLLVYFKVTTSSLKFNVHFIMCIESTHLLQIFVTVDELALMRVLEFVGLDVLPQGLNDDRSGLGVDTQHASKPGVQLELRGLD